MNIFFYEIFRFTWWQDWTFNLSNAHTLSEGSLENDDQVFKLSELCFGF